MRTVGWEPVMSDPAVGLGFDVHAFVPGRALWLGGLLFEEEEGLGGHSDGDVVCHAIADALLGAVALGDVGEHFPDTDPETAGLAGGELLGRTCASSPIGAARRCRWTSRSYASGPRSPRDGSDARPARLDLRPPGRSGLGQGHPSGGTRPHWGGHRVPGPGGGRMTEELVTGRRAVVEAIRAGQVREVLVATGAHDTQGLRAVREAARAAKVPVRATERRELDRMADDHRGVVARTTGARAGRRPLGERDLATSRSRRMRSSSSWTGSRIRRTSGPRRGRPKRLVPRRS